MANRTKDPNERSTATINVRCSPNFKAKVETAFDEGRLIRNDGKPAENVSDYIRDLIEADLARRI